MTRDEVSPVSPARRALVDATLGRVDCEIGCYSVAQRLRDMPDCGCDACHDARLLLAALARAEAEWEQARAAAEQENQRLRDRISEIRADWLARRSTDPEVRFARKCVIAEMDNLRGILPPPPPEGEDA